AGCAGVEGDAGPSPLVPVGKDGGNNGDADARIMPPVLSPALLSDQIILLLAEVVLFSPAAGAILLRFCASMVSGAVFTVGGVLPDGLGLPITVSPPFLPFFFS